MDTQSPSTAKTLAAQFQMTSHSRSCSTQLEKIRRRRPLQPKNILTDRTPIRNLKPKPKQSPTSPADNNNKENELTLTATTGTAISPVKAGLADGSLAEELSAVRERSERLRLDEEITEMVLKEKDRQFGLKLMELNERGEVQQEVEMELDRLFRLKQLQIAFEKLSPIRSLREKEMEKKTKNKEVAVVMQNEDLSFESEEEWINQSGEDTPCSKITYSTSGMVTSPAIRSTGSCSSSKITCSTSETTPCSALEISSDKHLR